MSTFPCRLAYVTGQIQIFHQVLVRHAIHCHYILNCDFAVRLSKLHLWSIYVTSILFQLPLEATRFNASFIRFHKSLKGLSATWCMLRLCLEAPQKTVGNKNVKIKSTPLTDARNSHMYTSNIGFVKWQHKNDSDSSSQKITSQPHHPRQRRITSTV